MTTEQRLARLKNYQTRYEVIAEKDGNKILIGYTSAKSRRGVYQMLRQSLHNGYFGLLFSNDVLTWRKRASDGCDLSGYWVHFSGRTQRESILGGEHVFIGELDGKYAATDFAL